jgi:hypothetical protein
MSTETKNEPRRAPAGMSVADLVAALLSNDPSFNPEIFDTINWYCPDFTRFEAMSHAMFLTAQTSTYFTNETKKYFHEMNDKLYHAILFTILTIQNMSKHGLASSDQIDVLDGLTRSFPLGSLPIAGPFRPFYMSLMDAKSTDTRYGSIVPYIPPVSQMQMTAARYQLAPTPLWSLKPNIVGLIRSNAQSKMQHGANAGAWRPDFDIWDNQHPGQVNPLNDTWNDNSMLQWRRWEPGFKSPALGFENYNAYVESQLSPNPPIIMNNVNIENELQEMSFNGNFNWFESLVYQQNRYTRYWQDSTSLDHLAVTGAGAGLHVNVPTIAANKVYRQADMDAAIAAHELHQRNQQGQWEEGHEQANVGRIKHRLFDYLNAVRNNNGVNSPFSADINVNINLRIRERQRTPEENFKLSMATGVNSENITVSAADHLNMVIFDKIRKGPYWPESIKFESSVFRPSVGLQRTTALSTVFIVKPRA